MHSTVLPGGAGNSKTRLVSSCYEPKTGTYFFEGEQSFFVTLALKITGACNQNCRNCCTFGSNGFLSLGNAKGIMEKLSKAGLKRLIITGGEPLLHPQLSEILHLAKSLFPSVGLSTNATLLEENIVPLVADCCDNVKLTILGKQKTHDKITGSKGSFEKVIKSIKLLKSFSVPVHVHFPVFSENVADASSVLAICSALGVEKVSFYSNIRKGKGIEIADKGKEVSPDSIYKFVAAQQKKSRAFKLTFVDWKREGQYGLIEPDGRITCFPLPDNSTLSLGNLLADSFESVWRHYPFKSEHISFYRNH